MLYGPTARGYLWIFSLMMLNGGPEQAACLMGRAVVPWHPPRPHPGPPLTFRNCPAQDDSSHDGNSCFLQAAGGTEGWKFHTPFPPSVFLPSLPGTSVLSSRLTLGLHHLSTSQGSESLSETRKRRC